MNTVTFLSALLVIATLSSAWSQGHYLIEVREVEVPNPVQSASDEGDATKDQVSPEKKVLNVMISHIKGGAHLSYKRLVSGNYQLLFRGKLTELEDGRVKVEYMLDQSILGTEPPEPLRIAGTIETAVGSNIDPVVLEGSDVQSNPDGASTHWELIVREFDDEEVLNEETNTP